MQALPQPQLKVHFPKPLPHVPALVLWLADGVHNHTWLALERNLFVVNQCIPVLLVMSQL